MHKDIPKTVIIGASGFLGKYFLAAYREIYPDCVGTTRGVADGTSGLHFLDLSNPNIKPLGLSKTEHKEALILAAVNKIDTCEEEKSMTRKVNVDGTLELIRQLVDEGIKPIFFSSDYVFDGEKGFYPDNALTNPKTEYGRQKADVEAVIDGISKSNFLTVRLSKIFSLDQEDHTFLDQMAHTLISGGIVEAAYDQVFCPTLISDLINIVTWLQARKETGIVNVCSPEIWSRYNLALEMARALKVNLNMVRRISLEELQGPRRPKNTSMKTAHLSRKSSYAFTPIAECILTVAKKWRQIAHEA